MFKATLSGATAILLLSACSITVPATALMGDGSELFTGTATGGIDGTGEIALQGRLSGTKCFGGFHYTRIRGGTGSTGVADIQCEDGRKAQVQFLAESLNKGRGTGTDNFGTPFMFTYGMTEEESTAAFKKLLEGPALRNESEPEPELNL